MLTHIDRVQIVTPDRAAVARQWYALLGAAHLRDDRVGVLGATRTVIRIGMAEVEFLQPDGAGIVADFMQESGRGGLFAAGFASDDFAATGAHLRSRGVALAEEGGQLFIPNSAVSGGGFRAVVSAQNDGPRAGVMTRLHEVTFLTPDPQQSAASLVETFQLSKENFGTAESEVFGFAGIHVNLTTAHRDDIETVKPTDPGKAMGRFFARRGSSLYMCFGESDDLERVRALAMEHAPDDWTGPREGPLKKGSIFLHPKPLGGVMLGVRAAT
ncbi:MAG: hypothetical protein FJ037_06875 [Chloroflexi bacterium]|nr:hypothetical protein [Chloroflexota bacterium]